MVTTEGFVLQTEQDVISDPIDLLERDEYIERLLDVAQTLSENKKNASYALNGVWGVGKSFVLNLFERKLREYGLENTTISRYIVFHYNCWKYDFYEEPLIAIIATILDQIDEQCHLLSPKQLELVKEVLKNVGFSLINKAYEFIKNKTGVDIKDATKRLSNIDTSATKEIEAKHIYDQYFDLKKTLQKLTETLKKLADNQTIVLVVDELDRCLPEYSIKVLERLHHIFYDIPNIQVVLAIDKSQLENTVRKIFGENVSVKLYLDKFIDFELKLSAGKINQHFQRAYPTYFNRFTYDITPYPIVYEVCTMLLDGLEARVWNALIKKMHPVSPTLKLSRMPI